MNGERLYKKLIEYGKSDYYPFHMPGHKRKSDCNSSINEFQMISPYKYDITEIEGFDNLNNPQGIIEERMKEVSGFYQSQKSYYLVNGSTCGILTAISALVHSKKSRQNNSKKIIVARNCHKSVYNAILVNDCEAVYINPKHIKEYNICGGIDFQDVKNVLDENRDACGVFITSPTYEGIVSDIKKIADVCHEYDIPLVVDEAHGAHFSMHYDFPDSALECGADVVIQSLHKTLPALTQTAILHISKKAKICMEEVERYMRIFQTSSPSYVLLGSIDKCLDDLMKDTYTVFNSLSLKIDNFKRKCEKLTNIRIIDSKIIGKNGVYNFDKSKIVIYPISTLYSGTKLYKELYEKYHLQMEMASLEYVIAMTSINDIQEGFDRLYNALESIDREIRIYDKHINIKKCTVDEWNIQPVVCEKISTAVYEDNEEIFLERAEGRISGEFIYMYPPGVPIILPGEMYTGEIIEYLKNCIESGASIVGMKNGLVKVNKENWRPLSFAKVKLKGKI